MLLLTSVRAPTRTLSSNSWDDYKHHVLLNWVDGFDTGQDAGLAILVDRTSGYLHGQQHPLGLILVTGREEARPVGTETRRFTLMPHRGDWQQAGLWNRADGWNTARQVTALGETQAELQFVDGVFSLPMRQMAYTTLVFERPAQLTPASTDP